MMVRLSSFTVYGRLGYLLAWVSKRNAAAVSWVNILCNFCWVYT